MPKKKTIPVPKSKAKSSTKQDTKDTSPRTSAKKTTTSKTSTKKPATPTPTKTNAKTSAKTKASSTTAKKSTTSKTSTKKPATPTPTKTNAKTSAKTKASRTSAKKSTKSSASTKKATKPIKKTSTSTNTSAKSTSTRTTGKTKKSTTKTSLKKNSTSLSKIAKKIPLPFSINEYVFYPNEGVGKIIGTEDRMLEGELTPYYIIEFPLQKMINRVPIKNCKKVKLRKIVSTVKAKNTLKIFEAPLKKNEMSWKDRLFLYQEINGRGNIIEMAEMLSSLFIRKQVRANLSFQERQVYDFTLEAVSTEIAIVLKTTYEDTQREIIQRLTQNYRENEE